MIGCDVAPCRETHIWQQMERLNDAIEQAEKAQAEQQERLVSVLTQEAALLEGKAPSPPKPMLVPLASTVADFADRVLRLAKRTTETTARVEL